MKMATLSSARTMGRVKMHLHRVMRREALVHTLRGITQLPNFGLTMAYHLITQLQDLTFLILEN